MEARFAALWPVAEHHGWRLEKTGAFLYVTPPERDPRRLWPCTWDYIAYNREVVHVPDWFEREVKALPSPPSNQVVVIETDYEELPPPPKKMGWKKWLKSFIW